MRASELLSAISASGFPMYFPTLFGSGKDGNLVTAGSGAGSQSDVGYLGSFGPKEYENLTISAGDTWAVGQGTSSGAMMLAVSGTLTVAGSLIANGGNAPAYSGTPSSQTSGAAAGGGAAATRSTGNGTQGVGLVGTAPTQYGHGANFYGLSAGFLGGSGSLGAYNRAAGSNVTDIAGVTVYQPALNTGSAFSTNYAMSRLFRQNLFNIYDTQFGSSGFLKTLGGTNPTNSFTPGAYNTNSDYGPNATSTIAHLLSRDFVPGGIPGFGGGCFGQNSVPVVFAGNGGGPAGVIIIECKKLVLISGYAIQARGGNGSDAIRPGSAGTGMGGGAGSGGTIIIIAHEIVGSQSSIDANAGTPGVGAGSPTPSNGQTGLAGNVIILRM